MHLYERGYQFGMGIGMKLMPSPKQEILSGPGSLLRIPEILQERGFRHPLIVTGPRVSRTDFFHSLAGALSEKGLRPEVFSEVEPDPQTELVRRVIDVYREGGCDCFIALGGGSNMDAAKAAAAGLARPDKTLRQLGGVLKVRRRTPFIAAVPTTAGTGSECTVAAVITDSETHRKFAINDPSLCPGLAVLDADLTGSLPAPVAAASAMDALTHAVEAWLNRAYHKPQTPRQCAKAVHDILQYLPFVFAAARGEEPEAGRQDQGAREVRQDKGAREVWQDKGARAARQKLLEASFLAGKAFTVACVGNVHAIAHTLGGLYHIPHGQANAALLPIVLEDYGEKVWKSLAKLVRRADAEHLIKGEGPMDSDEETAKAFIGKIREMNREMGIPGTFPQIREEDIEQMAAWAVKEANPLYPVPVIYGAEDVKRILNICRR